MKFILHENVFLNLFKETFNQYDALKKDLKHLKINSGVNVKYATHTFNGNTYNGKFAIIGECSFFTLDLLADKYNFLITLSKAYSDELKDKIQSLIDKQDRKRKLDQTVGNTYDIFGLTLVIESGYTDEKLYSLYSDSSFSTRLNLYDEDFNGIAFLVYKSIQKEKYKARLKYDYQFIVDDTYAIVRTKTKEEESEDMNGTSFNLNGKGHTGLKDNEVIIQAFYRKYSSLDLMNERVDNYMKKHKNIPYRVIKLTKEDFDNFDFKLKNVNPKI